MDGRLIHVHVIIPFYLEILQKLVLTYLSGELGELWNGECILDRELSLEGHETSHDSVLPEANNITTT